MTVMIVFHFGKSFFFDNSRESFRDGIDRKRGKTVAILTHLPKVFLDCSERFGRQFLR